MVWQLRQSIEHRAQSSTKYRLPIEIKTDMYILQLGTQQTHISSKFYVLSSELNTFSFHRRNNENGNV